MASIYKIILEGREFLGHVTVEVLAGLIGIALTIITERLLKHIKNRGLEKRYPIAGEYLSRYEDKGKRGTAPTTLKQHGAKVTGVSIEKHRKWILEGSVTEDGYLQGRYSPENVHDKGFGAFFLKIDKTCDMHGYWFGRDSSETAIQYGAYEFFKNSTVIDFIQPGDITDALTIAEQQLGDAYISRDDLEFPGNGIALSARVDNVVAGFGTAKIVDSDEFYRRFEPFFQQDPTKLRALRRRLPEATDIGLVASVAVADTHRGRGIGTALMERCTSELREMGVTILVATAWNSKNGINAESMLLAEGFQRVLDVPDFWKEDSVKNNYSCPVCGAPPCVCAAALFLRSL